MLGFRIFVDVETSLGAGTPKLVGCSTSTNPHGPRAVSGRLFSVLLFVVHYFVSKKRLPLRWPRLALNFPSSCLSPQSTLGGYRHAPP